LDGETLGPAEGVVDGNREGSTLGDLDGAAEGVVDGTIEEGDTDG